MKLTFAVTKKQQAFLSASADEVLFGGAAGGGKSYAQLIDALLYALRYPKSKQLILRRTYPELEKSLIRTALGLYPTSLWQYSATAHTGRFANGSIIDFGYLATESDVYRYQSAEYDTIRFDELTHFSEYQYLYMLSRLRGANTYPKQVKSATNPGGVGHGWVKARFIDPAPYGTPFSDAGGSVRVFLPARLEDNRFLCEADPDYRKRLLLLPESQRRALLEGDWNVFDGQYFSEFSYDLHTCEPFEIPASWRKWRTIDYGLDCLACLWIAMNEAGEVYVYREFCQENMVISKASEQILERTPQNEAIYATLAPPDLWQRSQESGRSKALLFAEYGVHFTKTANDRETGWLAVKELLRPRADGTPRLKIFRTCRTLLRCLPLLQYDEKKPCDVANEPHDITHAPDALRGFAIYFARPTEREPLRVPRALSYSDFEEDYHNADSAGRAYLRRKWMAQKT